MFWKERDPLNLTPYNERLLEHYTRIAYSNLRFGIPKLNITGWKTDRGTVVIRYGVPPFVTRIRPTVVAGVRNDVIKEFPHIMANLSSEALIQTLWRLVINSCF